MIENLADNKRKLNLLTFVKRYEIPISLTILIALYLLLSNFFAWSQAFANLFFNTSGGSDPYFNYYIIQYILNYKAQLLHTIALNYPLGSGNPRPPFFHWMIVFVALVLSPILGLNNAAYFAFNEFDAVFGALLIIPVYLIGKEAFGKKVGIVGAFLYTIMPGNLSAGIISDGRMHTPELLFAFLVIYFFERAINLSKKNLILDHLFGVKSYPSSILRFYSENKLATIYALMAGAALGGLMLSWQGYTYIEVVVLIYVAIQGIFNLLMRRPSGYLTYYTTVAMGLGFLMGFYYYYGSTLIITWYVPALIMAIMVIAFLLLVNIIGRKSWVITIPLTIIISLAGFFALSKIDPSVVNDLITGEGYFIKTRVYTTIAEAAPLPLGQYINSFGVGQFIIGISGLVYVVYKYVKQKTDILLFILVFSIVSIFMSFEAARFNITAAPAYAVLGGALLLYFADMVKISDLKKRNKNVSTVKKSIKGNISWVHASFAVIIVLALVLPSGIGMINSAIPANSANTINDAIYNELPSFMRPNNTSGAAYFGASGFYIDNKTQPLAQSFAWLSTQNTNLPLDQRPAYVSWWDYGFQELYQGQHPTVADDFQQGYVPAGQILLAQNESQIVGVFVARIIKGYLDNTHNFTAINQTLITYLGASGAKNIMKDYADPAIYTSTITGNESIYGPFISNPTADDVYYGYIRGYLSSNYPMSTITDLYVALESVTGYDIQYVQIDHGLFPESGIDPGIFYAPAYLTDMKTYTYDGEIVPNTYYQIYANTSSGIYPLDQLPADAAPTAYYIEYNPSFYNTSIYRFMVGYPPSAVGQSNGVPGLTYGSTRDEVMPGWNMSNFEVAYLGIPYNPYKNYSAHPSAWTTIPIQTAYNYEVKGKGTVVLLPTLSEIFNGADPIMAYYPGAEIEGRVTMENGQPVAGVYLTIFDQYGIPHQVVQTNSNGYYNLTALPGNDSVLISSGTLNPLTLVGSNFIGNASFRITQAEAERIPTVYNSTTGLPDYEIQFNYQLKNSSISGRVGYEYNYPGKKPTTVYANNGYMILTNATYNSTVTLPLSDGYYTDTTIQPYSYEASLLLNGTLYRDVEQLNVTIGGSFVYDVLVNYNQVFVNVTIGGNNVDNFNLEAYGNGHTYYGKEVNNSYVIYVPEGTFRVIGTADGSSTYPAYVTFDRYGTNTTLDLTAYQSVNVTGYVPEKTGSIYFYQDGQSERSFEANISGGAYSINLISGIYTVYYSNGKDAYLRTYDINT
ncbi:MAG: STT3 domain-containing protein, partial [Thermoplasmata archaeon]